jgi:putative flippase GtrA
LVIFLILSSLTQINTQVCFIIAFYLAVLCRFIVDRRLTFGIKFEISGMRRQFVRYLLSCTVTMLVGLAVFHLCLCVGISSIISKIISILPVTITGYVLFRIFVFKLGLK